MTQLEQLKAAYEAQNAELSEVMQTLKELPEDALLAIPDSWKEEFEDATEIVSTAPAIQAGHFVRA